MFKLLLINYGRTRWVRGNALRPPVWYLRRTHHRQLYLFAVSVYPWDTMTLGLTIITTLSNRVVLERMDTASNIVGRHKVLRSTVPSSGSNSEGCGILVGPVGVDRGQAPDTSMRYVVLARQEEKNAGTYMTTEFNVPSMLEPARAMALLKLVITRSLWVVVPAR